MKGKFLIVMVVFLLAVTAVSANTNDTADALAQTDDAGLEKTYYYDSEADEEYDDDTVVTHNLVKYYGDKDTKFKVKVYDDDYAPMKGVYVSFRVDFGKSKEKTTNKNGIVYFAINKKPGKYYVETEIESEDGSGYWYTENTVKIKSTIPTKELVKYSKSKKKFKIAFVDTKGKPLKNKLVKIKKNGYWYKLKTDKKGYAKIRSTFKVGKTKITAYNPVSKEKMKISVVVLRKGTHKINIPIVVSDWEIKTKKLKNGDCLNTVYETKYRQYYPGVYVEATGGGLSYAKHTKLVKAKYYFKNTKTGKVITKTSSKVRADCIVVKPIKGYNPYKATVWYKDKK